MHRRFNAGARSRRSDICTSGRSPRPASRRSSSPRASSVRSILLAASGTRSADAALRSARRSAELVIVRRLDQHCGRAIVPTVVGKDDQVTLLRRGGGGAGLLAKLSGPDTFEQTL